MVKSIVLYSKITVNERIKIKMGYPKVSDFLSHVVTGTQVSIEDGIIDNLIYFKGTIRDYFDSDIPLVNLTLIQSFIRDDVFVIKALKDYVQD